MADFEATQPATQQALDPRRMGEDDLITEPDQADIICILHPGSPSASRIVQRTAEKRVQHILQNQTALGEAGEIVSLHNSNRSLDLALRFSSTPLQPFGFTFGRNPNLCDIVLKDDTEASKQISNMHFCISVNDNGVLVVEDSSTNGTIVDNVILRSKSHRQGSKRILSNGSTIQPLSRDVENLIIFHVRIPARDGHVARYKANFENFMRKIRQMRAGQSHNDKAEVRPVPQSNPTTLVFTSNRFGMKWDGSPKYKVTGFLGRGAFANVYQLTTCYDGELFAVKELEKRRFVKDNVLDRRLVNELNIMKAIDHESIVNFIEFHDTKDYLYIIMEYVGCGDLQQMLKNQLLTEPQGKELARQTLDALAYLHAKRVTHRDIKPDNILIASMDPFIVKLSDFGLSKEETEVTFAKTFCGTLLYCAPEVFPHYNEQQGRKRRHSARQAKYTTAVDIWSLGGVLWFAICGAPPFEGVVDPQGRLMYERITTTKPNVPQLNQKGISGDAQSLLLKMLTIQPEDRPSAIECLADPWLFQGIPPSQYGPELELNPADAVDEKGFSQLSIGDVGLDMLDQNVLADIEEEMDDLDEEMMQISSKRVKRDEMYPRNQVRDYSEPDPETASDQMSEPEPFPPPSTDDQANAQQEGRLFGEIDTAALESSGLLRQHATDALNRDPRQYNRHHRRPTPNGGIAAGQERTGLLPSAFPSDAGLAAELDIGYSQESAYSPEYSGQSLNASIDDLQAIQQEHQSPGSQNTPREAAPSLISNGTTPRQLRIRQNADQNSNESNRPPTALSLRPSPFVGSNGTSQGRYWEASSQPSQLQWQHKFRANSMPSEFAADLEANPPLGTLISTMDSFRPLFHRINARATTWGRNPRCTIPHDDTQDLRIPKTSLGIRFEGPGLNAAESAGADWKDLPGLFVLVKNFSTKHPIWINETMVPPLSSEGDDLCGRLHSGDVITILQPRDDSNIVPRPADTLRFICDFSVGEAREPRKSEFEIFDFKDFSQANHKFTRSGTTGTESETGVTNA
jgi:serine/threonine protein kinase